MSDREHPDADLAAAYQPTPRGAHLDDETWDKLVQDTLGASERAAALDHVVTCRTCAEIHRGLLAFGREAGAFDPRPRRGPAPVPVWAQALAATLVVAVAGWLALRSGTPPVPAPSGAPTRGASPLIEKPEVYVAAENALVMRGGSTPANDYAEKLQKALAAYRSDDYDKAVDALADLGRQYPNAVEPPLYEGISRMLLGQVDAAVPALERASRLAGPDLKDMTEYHLAEALKAGGDVESARGKLAALCRGEGPYRAKACREASPQR